MIGYNVSFTLLTQLGEVNVSPRGMEEGYPLWRMEWRVLESLKKVGLMVAYLKLYEESHGQIENIGKLCSI